MPRRSPSTNNGSKGDEVEVAGVANSQGVTTYGDEAPMGGVPTMVDTRQDQQDELLPLGETQERSGCQHHWVLDTPKGPVSKGACRSCGEERDFPTYIEGSWPLRRKNS